MTTILLTRPRAASEKLAQALRRAGYHSLIEPLLAIEKLETPCPDTSAVEAVMMTSANALDALEEHEAQPFFRMPCFCVGAKTAEAARVFGFRQVECAEGDGADLARLVNASPAGQGKSVLHIAAQDTDSKAQDELRRLGCNVVVWRVYAANPVRELPQDTVRRLQEGGIDVVLVFSKRTAAVLSALLAHHQLRACCESLTAIGLSRAVTDVLLPLPWRTLAAAALPTEDAMIECLKRLHPA